MINLFFYLDIDNCISFLFILSIQEKKRKNEKSKYFNYFIYIFFGWVSHFKIMQDFSYLFEGEIFALIEYFLEPKML